MKYVSLRSFGDVYHLDIPYRSIYLLFPYALLQETYPVGLATEKVPRIGL